MLLEKNHSSLPLKFSQVSVPSYNTSVHNEESSAPTPQAHPVKNHGQIFTPSQIVTYMWSLSKNKGRVLEPSSGEGVFYNPAREMIMVEKDPTINKVPATLIMDFFDHPPTEKYATIIGNPPYVRNRDIDASTAKKLNYRLFDRHANLYLFFIAKAIEHLEPLGELIFITPRDFIKATGAAKLNEYIYSQGTITHFKDFGDTPIFNNASPNCAVWRFVKGLDSHMTDEGLKFSIHNGQIFFGARGTETVRDYFQVKVGAVSGADSIYEHEDGNLEMVCSSTYKTGKTKKMIYNRQHPVLMKHKQRLIKRRIRRFNESNWWEWGRGYPMDDRERIYVNAKTRHKRPFFIHPTKAYDGSVLGLFPVEKHPRNDMEQLCEALNSISWEKLGFVTGGRFIFNQRSLENALVGKLLCCGLRTEASQL